MACRNSGSNAVQGVHQHDPGAGADAADPDDLAGHLDHRELLEQVPPVRLQGAPVLAQDAAQLLVQRAGLHVGKHLFGGDDHRGVADDPPPPVDQGGELIQRLRAVAGVGLGQQRLGGLEPFGLDLGPVGLDLGPELAQGGLDVQVCVPDVQEGLLREGSHRRAVALGRREGDLAPGFGGEAVVPPGHGQARGQPLDIPLERAGQRLVEVVEIEDQPPFRRGERAEIGQVRVPAQLHPQPRRGSCGQIRRHRQRCSPVERERRHQHPAVPDRYQLRHPRFCLPQQQADRIPGSARPELRMRLQCGRRPGVLASRRPVRATQRLRRRGSHPAPVRCSRTRPPARDAISRRSHDHSLCATAPYRRPVPTAGRPRRAGPKQERPRRLTVSRQADPSHSRSRIVTPSRADDFPAIARSSCKSALRRSGRHHPLGVMPHAAVSPGPGAPGTWAVRVWPSRLRSGGSCPCGQ